MSGSKGERTIRSLPDLREHLPSYGASVSDVLTTDDSNATTSTPIESEIHDLKEEPEVNRAKRMPAYEKLIRSMESLDEEQIENNIILLRRAYGILNNKLSSRGDKRDVPGKIIGDHIIRLLRGNNVEELDKFVNNPVEYFRQWDASDRKTDFKYNDEQAAGDGGSVVGEAPKTKVDTADSTNSEGHVITYEMVAQKIDQLATRLSSEEIALLSEHLENVSKDNAKKGSDIRNNALLGFFQNLSNEDGLSLILENLKLAKIRETKTTTPAGVSDDIATPVVGGSEPAAAVETGSDVEGISFHELLTETNSLVSSFFSEQYFNKPQVMAIREQFLTAIEALGRIWEDRFSEMSLLFPAEQFSLRIERMNESPTDEEIVLLEQLHKLLRPVIPA